jgi:glucose-1-phosphate adenylyltransferase
MIQQSSTPVFILAGGAGERLAPLTQVKPKPAVSFGGTHQIIDFTFSNCINSGLRKIFVLTQHQREPLHDYIRENRQRMSQFFRWHEGDELRPVPPVGGKRYRGTADAVFQNLPLLRFDTADHVLITSADHVYAMDYRKLISRHAYSGADLTILTARRPVTEATAFGVLDVENGAVTQFREKPSAETLPKGGEVQVSMGVYVFRRQALLDIADSASPMETDFGRDIVPKLIRRQTAAAYEFGDSACSYWRDVGTLDSYFQANMDLLASRPEIDLESDAEWPIHSLRDATIRYIRDSRISRQASVRTSTIRRSIISHGARIEPGAVVEDSLILPDARIGRNARVRNTIVAEGAYVPDGVMVGVRASEDRSRFQRTAGEVTVVGNTIRNNHVIPAGRPRPVSAAIA